MGVPLPGATSYYHLSSLLYHLLLLLATTTSGPCYQTSYQPLDQDVGPQDGYLRPAGSQDTYRMGPRRTCYWMGTLCWTLRWADMGSPPGGGSSTRASGGSTWVSGWSVGAHGCPRAGGWLVGSYGSYMGSIWVYMGPL